MKYFSSLVGRADVGVAARVHHVLGHGALAPGGGRREVAAGAEQVHAGGRGPQREPAVALARVFLALVAERRGVEQLGAARVGHAAEHQVAARVQPRRRVAEHQHRSAAGPGAAGAVGIAAARVELVARAHAHVDAADGAGLHAQRAAQVDQRAVEAVLVPAQRRVRVQGAADAQVEVAAAREHELAAGRHAAGAGHGQVQAFAARHPGGVAAQRTVVEVDLAARADHAGVAPGLHHQVAAAQRAEAGEAHEVGVVGVAVAPVRVVLAVRAHHVGAEVNPPGRGPRVGAGRDAAAALAPEPGAGGGRADLAAHLGQLEALARAAAAADQVATQVAAGAQQQVAALLRIPGRVEAARTAVDQVLVGLAFDGEQDRAVLEQAAGLVVEPVGRAAHAGRGGGAGRVDAVGRAQREVAARHQVEVAGAGAQHAEQLLARRVVGRDAVRRHGRLVDGGVLAVAEVVHLAGVVADQADHLELLDLLGRDGRARNDLEAQHVLAEEVDHQLLARVRSPEVGGRRARARHVADLRAEAEMGVGQLQPARGVRLREARVGRAEVGAGHEAQVPRQRARGQHRRQRPGTALVAVGIGGPQVDHLDAARQLDLGFRGHHRALGQRERARQRHAHRQRHARGPDARGHAHRGRQAEARGQARAGRQRHGLAQHRAGRVQQLARGVAHVRAEYQARGHGQRLVEHHRPRQLRARGQRHGGGRQVEVQRAALLEAGAGVERDQAAVRDHEVAAEGDPAARQDPALVVGRGAAHQARAVEAVVDAAEDLEVARRADHQRARFARAVGQGLLRARVHARVAVAREVDVAVHVQVAVGVDHGVGHDLHAGAQVEALALRAQAREAAVHQRAVAQRGLDEGLALAVQAVEVGLVDDLVGTAVDARVRALRGALVGDEGIDRDRLRALDHDAARGLDGDVVGAAARCVERHRAVVLRGAGHAQVHARAAGDRERAAAGIELDDRAVGRVDRLAVAVAPQHAGAGIEHRRARERHAVARGQPDAAGLLAAGVDAARDREPAAVDREVDLARLKLVADHEVAALELEAAHAEGAALVEARVEALEVGDGLRAQLDVAGRVGHQRAARVVGAAAAGRDGTAQVDRARAGIECQGIEAARAVVARRQVDARARRLRDVAAAAFEHQVAAPAVLADVEEIDAPAREVEHRTLAQQQVTLRDQAQLAAGQTHRCVEAQLPARVEAQLGAQRLGRHRADRRRQRALGCRHRDATARADVVDRAGLAGHQRRGDQQLAAAAVEGLGAVVPGTLRLVDAEAAAVVGRDAFAGVQRHRAEAQGQAVVRDHRLGLGLGRVAEHDLARIHLEPTAAGAGAAAHHAAGRRGRAVPHQGIGLDARHVAGAAMAVDGRRGQHQLRQRGLAVGRRQRRQPHRFVEVDRVARGQHQVLERR
ncbi:MAG: hypothetical protein GAK39_03517 [Variovorax sp.]|nr:MAG: hypothetical protein GAK39_03517 [Variovorax sp.]